ncbi:MAG: single-stranded-DNA-specific exonuclease RecJ [Alphaproteobacteria bacterium]|nr:single-stranded-DNA-specific exonuclease RecJ [Alphaproteobacteria bacterium]
MTKSSHQDVESLSGYVWRLQQTDERMALAIAQRFDLPDIVARILASRGFDLDSVPTFLFPTLKQHLPNPFSLKDMEKCANRMADAVLANEPIGLMGDYDVDGATSTAELKMYLESCGTKVFTFIPEREDGYGPNARKMQEYKDAGCSVVATLDCGTTSFEPIDFGTKLGLDIIILDHHNADPQLPNAFGIVNPKRLDEDTNHPCRYLAACGVVFLFIVALNKILRDRGFWKDKTEPNLMTYLDLVAFGTVCDVVKLTGVNRLFVKSGLKQFSTGNNIGLAALAKQLNLEESPSTYHLGYLMGPRVNACGRVGKSDLGMKLLSSRDPIEATILSEELEKLNTLRREIENDVFLQAMEQVESHPLDKPFIVVQGENWHQGVVGIVAGRLKERYNLPVFALSIEGDDIKGSSRSVTGVDIGTLVMNALDKKILSRGGGHPMAAGFSLEKSKLNDFIQYLTDSIKPELLNQAPSDLMADGMLDLAGVTPQLVQKLELLAPFGEANPEPMFIIKDVRITYASLLKNGHLSVGLSNRDGLKMNAIAFRSADTEMGKAFLTTHGEKFFDLMVTLKRDTWRGHTKIQIQILDAKYAD